MPFLLSLSRRIDGFTEFIGRSVAWLVLAAVLISAVNAVVRKAFNIGSNAFLEIQWYLFAAVFLLAAGYTMLRQEHVKIDVLSGRFSKRTQIWIDIIGICLLPVPVHLHDHQAGDAAGDQRLRHQGGVVQRRRPDPLAGVRAAAAGLACCWASRACRN